MYTFRQCLRRAILSGILAETLPSEMYRILESSFASPASISTVASSESDSTTNPEVGSSASKELTILKRSDLKFLDAFLAVPTTNARWNP